MLKRAVIAGFLLVFGAAMLGSEASAPLGVLLLAIGLSLVALPSYLRRTRTG